MFSLIIALLAVLGPKEILQLSPKQLAEKIASTGTAGGLAAVGTVAGMTSLFLHLACIIKNGRKLLTSHLDDLRTKLALVEKDFKVTKSDIDKRVTERMK